LSCWSARAARWGKRPLDRAAAVELAGGKNPRVTDARWTAGPSWTLHVTLQYR